MSSSSRHVVIVAQRQGTDRLDFPEVVLHSEGDVVGYLLDLTVPPDRRPHGCLAESNVNLAVWEHYEDSSYCAAVTKSTPTPESVAHLYRVLEPGGWVLVIDQEGTETPKRLADYGFQMHDPIHLDHPGEAIRTSRGSVEEEIEVSLADFFGWG